MDDTLRTCHPAVSFAYFALVIACAMLLMHPVCLVLSTLGGGWYVARLLGGKGLRRHLLWLLPMALLAAAVNPAFVHQGVTILAYLPSGNPLTLESLLYGLAAGAMLSAVALWFVCVTDVITSDKVVYLFGRVIPALSLLLSMILRFVPALSGGSVPWRRPSGIWAVIPRPAPRPGASEAPFVCSPSLSPGAWKAGSLPPIVCAAGAMACRGGHPSPSTALTGVTVPSPSGWPSAACICWAAVWPAACAFSITPCCSAAPSHR